MKEAIALIDGLSGLPEQRKPLYDCLTQDDPASPAPVAAIHTGSRHPAVVRAVTELLGSPEMRSVAEKLAHDIVHTDPEAPDFPER